MRYPEFLKDGGRIGYIAPSFGAADEWYGARFDAALEKFEALGYKNIEGPNCRLAEGIGKSNTPEKCAAEIMDYFTKDLCDVIISAGGGETMCEDLSYVDFDALSKAKAKWYMGYSDNTNLTFTLPVLCDTAAVYGQCATSFGQREWHESLHDDLRILTGKTDRETGIGNASRTDDAPVFSFTNYPFWEGSSQKTEEESDAAEQEPQMTQIETAGTEDPELKEAEDPCAPWELNRTSCLTAYRAGGTEPTQEKVEFSGRLIGGCMDCLQILCGTKYDRVKEFAEKYREDGIVWFLEACDLNPMSMRRALWQFREAGWFSHVKGFIIGRPLHFEEDIMGMNRTNAVTGILKELGVPYLMDTDLGHLPPAIPYISGAIAEVTAEAGKMTVRQILR